MSIKNRLLISHLIMFIVPLFMAAMTAVIFLSVAFIFSRGNNYLYLENMSKCTHAAELSYHILSHGDLIHPENSIGQWLISILSPTQNFILFSRENTPIYIYGNRSYLPQLDTIPLRYNNEDSKSHTTNAYIYAEDCTFYYARKTIYKNESYYFYFISNNVRREYNPSDEAVEHIFKVAGWLTSIFTVLSIFLTSRFLSLFMTRHIVPPLNHLWKGAEEIQEGNLSVRLVHKTKDEYWPVFQSFNLMAEKLSQSLQKQKEEEASRKELIASISHDIRTPLTSIRAYSEGLRDGVADTEEKKQKYLEIICKRTKDLDHMINQLFELSKLDIGRKAYSEEVFDLSACLHRFTEENKSHFREQGLLISCTADTPLFIKGNKLLINRILTNLASNSIKYKNKAECHFSIVLNSDSNNAVLTVTDDGFGVPKNAIQHLFEAFYRTDKARSHTENGSGLGMTIIWKAVQLMNGQVSAKNNTPHGLIIEIKIPFVKGGSQQ